MDYTYRERHGEAIYRFKGLPSRRRGACPREGGGRHIPERLLPPQCRLELPGGRHRHRLRDVIGVDNMMWDNMMWGSDYPHSESTFPQSRKILAEILTGAPDDEQTKPAPDRDPGIAGGNAARVYNFDVARLTVPA
jgi:Amidohydrolase